MLSEKIIKAQNYEAMHMKEIDSQERPAFHVTGGIGWINDPNGFSMYKGEYHLFYQYHPYSTKWGPMHWGHLKSKDLITWERLPIVMAPDKPYDTDGCFSGSALELKDGRHLIMYTGVSDVQFVDGEMSCIQTQCMAVGDGVFYEKYEGNPVITGDMIPKGNSVSDFRDPKIWQEEDGTFYAVTVNQSKDEDGQMLLHRSDDGFHWEFVKVLEESHGEYGFMWECPDCFPLDEKHVLIFSPIGMHPKGLEYHVGHGCICMIGNLEKPSFTFTRDNVHSMDYGIDFYAPQTMRAADRRQILIAWMQAWSNSTFVPPKVKYFGQMTIPRELTICNNRLYQNPIREISNYWKDRIAYEKVEISDEKTLEGISGRTLDMTVTLKEIGKQNFNSFTIEVAKNEKFATTIFYDHRKGIITVDRSRSGYYFDIVHSRSFEITPVQDQLKLRILMDRYSLELFANDGEKTATFSMFTPQEATEICFYAEGTVLMDLEKYTL